MSLPLIPAIYQLFDISMINRPEIGGDLNRVSRGAQRRKTDRKTWKDVGGNDGNIRFDRCTRSFRSLSDERVSAIGRKYVRSVPRPSTAGETNNAARLNL